MLNPDRPPVVLTIEADEWDTIENLLNQLHTSENPVTSSGLKGSLAKRIARIWKHDEKFATNL